LEATPWGSRRDRPPTLRGTAQAWKEKADDHDLALAEGLTEATEIVRVRT